MRTCLLIAVVLAGAMDAKTADAAITINMYETGGDVVFSYSGSIQLSGERVDLGVRFSSLIEPRTSLIVFSDTTYDFYVNQIVPPQPQNGFGLGPRIDASVANNGDFFGFAKNIAVPAGYVNGTAIAGSMVFESTDFSSLGIDTTSAPYVWTLSHTGDTITLQVVPEPASALFLYGSVSLIGLHRRRRR